ncbi:protein kinase domain-containing protein [Streptomyces sp. T028]|uniref:serine/threonine-protein kinase n=1 Tax=Streptomyces sp. T028 TaxID=3394379 RepID=UPI003A89762D
MKPLRDSDPRALGPYRLLSRLGLGGMGQVFLARAQDGRFVAVKLIHPHLAEEPEFRRRFRREVAAARRVSGAGTASVVASDTEADIPWFASEFVPGPSLQRVVDEWRCPLPRTSVWHLARGLAATLGAIHGVGVLHRDLKPSNVLITLDGPRVIDFGIARAVDSSVATRTGAVIGSPGFMSPEQARGERLDEASDVFGLGALLAYAATGHGPFDGEDDAPHAVLLRVVSQPPRLDGMDGIDGTLRTLVERCMAPDPADRPSAADVEAEAVRAVGTELPDSGWLPPELTTRLGREAVRLLALEGPVPTQVDATARSLHHAPTASSARAPGPVAGTPPAGAPTPPPPAFSPMTPPFPPTRSRRRMAPVPAALGVVLVGGIVVSLVPALRDGGTSGAGSPGVTAAPVRSSAATGPTSQPTASPSPSSSSSSAETGQSTSPPPSPRQFDFNGTWRGIVNQGDGASIYDVEIEYTGGARGERVAKVDYPTLGCGGYWTLQGRTSDRANVVEHLTYGAGKCVDDVEISLTALDADTARYHFDDLGAGEGRLARD